MKKSWITLFLICLFVSGCSRDAYWAAENGRRASLTLSRWLTHSRGIPCFIDNDFNAEAFSNLVCTALSSAVDKENSLRPLRFPLCAKMSRIKMTDRDIGIFNSGIRDKLAKACGDKYEFEIIMFAAHNNWGDDRIYFVEECRDEVNVFVSEVKMLNEWNYSAGHVQLTLPNKHIVNDVGEGVGVYRVWISNVVDDAFRDRRLGPLSDFLLNVRNGAAFICWDSGPRPIACGNHVFNRQEFTDWISRSHDVYMLKPIFTTESEQVFARASW